MASERLGKQAVIICKHSATRRFPGEPVGGGMLKAGGERDASAHVCVNTFFLFLAWHKQVKKMAG